jgi:hypothetical protein
LQVGAGAELVAEQRHESIFALKQQTPRLPSVATLQLEVVPVPVAEHVQDPGAVPGPETSGALQITVWGRYGSHVHDELVYELPIAGQFSLAQHEPPTLSPSQATAFGFEDRPHKQPVPMPFVAVAAWQPMPYGKFSTFVLDEHASTSAAPAASAATRDQ